MINITDIDVLLPPRFEPNGEITDIVDAIRGGAWMGTVNLWVYRIRNGAVEVLFQQRDLESPTSPGLLDVSVAGYLHAGYDGVSGAVAEAAEELGLPIDPSRLVSMGRHLAAIRDQKGRERKLVAQNYCYLLEGDDTLRLRPEEVPAVFWVLATDFLALEAARDKIAIVGRSNADEVITRDVTRGDFVYNVNDFHYRSVERIVWREMAAKPAALA